MSEDKQLTHKDVIRIMQEEWDKKIARLAENIGLDPNDQSPDHAQNILNKYLNEVKKRKA
jgi:hypothetical protein